MDPITSINQISQLAKSRAAGQVNTSIDTTTADFENVLNNALQGLSQQEATANQAVAGLATGKDIELHEVMLAMEKADISFQLAMQVRNKLVEAYQEVMRIQV